MRNCDARMAGEVHKRFHEQRRNWSVLPKPRSVIAAVAVCVAMYFGTTPVLRAAPQQNISGSNSDRVSRAAGTCPESGSVEDFQERKWRA